MQSRQGKASKSQRNERNQRSQGHSQHLVLEEKQLYECLRGKLWSGKLNGVISEPLAGIRKKCVVGNSVPGVRQRTLGFNLRL